VTTKTRGTGLGLAISCRSAQASGGDLRLGMLECSMLPARPVRVALLVVGLVWAAVIVAWPEAVLGLTFDDSYYYAEIAQRLAAGEGSTFDGLHRTNGYHFLWMWSCALVFASGLDGELAMRALLLVQVGLALGGVALALGGQRTMARTGPDGVLAAVTVGAWLGVPMVGRTLVNGMEASVVCLVHGALLGVVSGGPSALRAWSGLRCVAVSALLSLAILARTDGALLTPVLALWWLGELRSAPRAYVGVMVGPTVTLGVFLAANQAWFDTPMQVSGTLKRVPLSAGGVGVLLGCSVAAAAVGWASRRAWSTGWDRLGSMLRTTGFYGVFCFVLLGYYTGLQTFARQWYFAPHVLWLTCALFAFALDLAARARSDRPDLPPVRALLPVGGIVVLPLLVAAGVTAGQLTSPDRLAVRRADRRAAAWVESNLPPGTRIGSWDAGLIAFHTTRPVINLDGVVNDVAWLRAMRAGTAGERLRQEGVAWYVNHSLYEDGTCVSLVDALAVFDAEAASDLTLVKAWDFEQRGRINGQAGGTHAMATCVMQLDPGANR